MPAGWTGLEYHVFLLNNIFLMINWSQDGLGWNGEPTGRLSAADISLSAFQKPTRRLRGLQSAPYLLSAARGLIGAKISNRRSSS